MSSMEATELTRGWNAAANLEPFDRTESNSWKEGYRLWQSRKSAARAARQHHAVSYASH